MWSDDEIKGKILHKLSRMGKFKHSHTSIDDLHKGFPSDLQGRVKYMVDELVRERVFFMKPTSYGMEISINPEKKERIMYYIRKFMEKE